VPSWLIAFDFKDLSDHEDAALQQGHEKKQKELGESNNVLDSVHLR